MSPTAPAPRGQDATRPFLKWAGGKRKVLPHILPLIPDQFGRYHEPFMGAGALFWALATRAPRPPGWALLTDTNTRLVRTFQGVRDSVEDVIARLAVYREHHSKAAYYEIRALDVDAMDSDAAVAAWLIYLNKTGFNGLYRVNRKGDFNVPLGSYKNPNICDAPTLRRCSKTLKKAIIVSTDFTAVRRVAKPGDVVYFDPPYVPVGSQGFTKYTADGFNRDDQTTLRDLALELRDAGVRVILSNHDTPEIQELYADSFEIRTFLVVRSINRVAEGRGGVREVLIT